MATQHFLLQPLVCGTVFHRTSVVPPTPLSPSSAVILNHISSHFLMPLSDASLICSVPVQRLIILDTIIAMRCNIFNTQCVSGCFPQLADCHLDSQSQVICISSVLTGRLCIAFVQCPCSVHMCMCILNIYFITVITHFPY